MKYHLNPFSGEPGLCKATSEGKCPFSSVEDHYSTMAEAREAYETRMANQLFAMTEADRFAADLEELREEASINLIDPMNFREVVTHLESLGRERGYALDLALELQKEFEEEPAYITELRAMTWQAEEAREEAEKVLHEWEAERHRPLTRLTVKPPRPFLPVERYHEINVDGIMCPHCDRQLSVGEVTNLHDHVIEICFNCKETFNLDSVKITVGPSKDTFMALSKEAVTKMVWFHSSTSDDWETTLTAKDGFYAHLGSFQASVDRQIAEHVNHEGKGFWLYEIALDPNARVSDEILSDDNGDYNRMNNPKTKPMESQITRYFNKWEDMASISLIADTNTLTVVNKRYVTAEESFQTPSIFNVEGAQQN